MAGRDVDSGLSFWQRQPPAVRRALTAGLIVALLMGLAISGNVRWSKDLWLLIAFVLLMFLAKFAYAGFWRVIATVGGKNAQASWERQPPFVQRATRPVVIAVVVIGIVWANGVAPDPSLIVLLLITYALYLLPKRLRRVAAPLTALALAVAYPFLIEQANYHRFLFNLPVFNAFPSM